MPMPKQCEDIISVCPNVTHILFVFLNTGGSEISSGDVEWDKSSVVCISYM